jgi:hypothetical protein
MKIEDHGLVGSEKGIEIAVDLLRKEFPDLKIRYRVERTVCRALLEPVWVIRVGLQFKQVHYVDDVAHPSPGLPPHQP